MQVWNKHKAHHARYLNLETTRAQSPCLIANSASLPKTNGDPEDSHWVTFEHDADQSEGGSSAHSPLFVQQDSISETLESLQSQYIELPTPLAETLSQPHTPSHCSRSQAAVSNSSRCHAETSFFEYTPESSISPEYLLPGEGGGGTVLDTLQSSSLQCPSTLDSKQFNLSESLTGVSRRQQHSADNHNPPETAHPKTPSLEPSCKIYEVAETPAQLSPSGSGLSCLESVPRDTTQFHNILTSQYLDSPGFVIRGMNPCHIPSYHAYMPIEPDSVQPDYWVSIPETILPNLSQHSENLSARAFIRPMLPLSSLIEQTPPAKMEGKETKPSDSSLPDTHSDQYGDLPGATPGEKIRNAWAQLSSENQGNAVETPSSMGDIEASIPASVPETTAPLSVRPDTDSFPHSHTAVHHGHSEPLLPASELAHGGHITQHSMQTIQPSALTVTGMDEIAPGSIHLGTSEFAVTLPMDSRVKDDYERVLSDAATHIRQFFDSFQSSSQISDSEVSENCSLNLNPYLTLLKKRDELYSNMREVIVRLNNVSTHPDLNISDHLKGVESDLAKEASWAEYSSAKFLFLGSLIELVGTNEIHLIIAVGDEKKQRILERYLQGKGFAYTRPREEMGSAVEVSLAKGSLSFGVHSSESARELFKPPSAIFALDSSFSSTSPSMQHIRTTYARNGNLLPVIWFLVANTSEHIERCLPDTPEPERLHLLVHYIARLHDEVGDLQDDALGVHEDAEEILGYLLGSAAGWPLPIIEPLNLVSMEELEVAIDSSSDDAPPQAPKRSLDEDPEDYSSKRARVGTQENSQLTESTKPPSQTLDRDLQSLEKNLIQMKAIHAAEKKDLQTELAQANSRLREVEKSLGILQHRYESRNNEFHKIRQERDRLTEKKSSNEERVEKQMNIISKLKEEREELNSQLEDARKTLKDGGGGPAELETLREEIRRLTNENSTLEHRARFEQRQSEYTREQYQTASTAAAQSGTENRQLTLENEALKRQVEGNMVRLHEINTQDTSARHMARIEELELTLAARDELLRKKEDELREIRKNRPSTRSTSTQPRSPKWAGSRPTSPGVSHNGNGNGNGGLSGRGSALRYSSEMRF